MDLHGLFVAEAIEKTEKAIQRAQSAGKDHLNIIVGKVKIYRRLRSDIYLTIHKCRACIHLNMWRNSSQRSKSLCESKSFIFLPTANWHNSDGNMIDLLLGTISPRSSTPIIPAFSLSTLVKTEGTVWALKKLLDVWAVATTV